MIRDRLINVIPHFYRRLLATAIVLCEHSLREGWRARMHYGNWPTATWIILNIPSLGEINRLLPICSDHKSLARREFPLSPGCVFKSAALFAQAGPPSAISASTRRSLSLLICLISTISGLCTGNNEPIVLWADIITPSIATSQVKQKIG